MLPQMRVALSPLSCLLSLLLLLLLLWCSGTACATEQNTVFLPFKVNAPEPDALDKNIHLILEKTVVEKGCELVSSPFARYSSWPPSAEEIGQIAEKTGRNYVAVGTLTQLGVRYSLDISVFNALQPDTPYTYYGEADSVDMLKESVETAVDNILGYINQHIIVASITAAGNVRIDTGAIIRKISTKPGDRYDPEVLRQDLKNVFSMGYFDNVEIEAEDTESGKKIIFRVQEKPLVSKVIFTGADKVKEEDVREAANINENTILNPARVNEGRRRIKELYKSKGYYNASIESVISYPTPEKAEVRFVLREGEKVSIREIVFQGNISYDDDDLEDIIKTSSYKWWYSWLTSAGTLKMDILEQDVSRIAAFYQNHGFIEARVGAPRIEEDGDKLTVIFPIEEGPRFRVGTVDITGDLIEDKQSMLTLLKIRKEEFLNRQVLREDNRRLADLYAEHGYAFAEIMPKVEKRDVEKRVNITLHITKGSLVYFNRIEIEGNTRTRDNVIRRDLAVEEGGLFNSKAIRESTRNLQYLGFFEDVRVTPRPSLSKDQMDVLVEVKEKSTGQFSVGAGYSTSENFMLMGQVKEDNFLGTGKEVSLSGKVSSSTTKYNINYTDPRLFDSKVSVGFDLYSWEKEYNDYTKNTTGGSVRFGHPFFGKWNIYYGYTLKDTELSDISDDASVVIVRSKDIHWTSAANLALVRDSRDNRYIPSKGSRNSVKIEYAGGPLGGDASFTKVEAKTGWWIPMIWDTVFRVKAVAGQAFENEEDRLPVYEHFYLGGMNSIRGFDSYSISPLDEETGEKIGGDKMWYGTVAVIFPVFKDIGMRGELFTDFGNVYATDEDWDFGEYKKSAGFAILWMSPLGPLRLAWGYNLDKQDDEDQSNWDFSMGGSF
ncbi:MAG: outer membrane protein assembly factor BamA [Desulfobulbus propionicus]|nr:MAG: outer membrane protein assembly factor BamA [Desulfobulbus propionicus]